MAGEAITKSLVEAAVNKGLHDLQENPARGIRNLVELGAMFAGGRYQQQFFQLAQSELENEASCYYRLVDKVVSSTSTSILKTFGMNLVYNCWNVGARKIRKKDPKKQFNIPWALIHELAAWQGLNRGLLESSIAQGKKLGIYCYIYSIGSRGDFLPELLQLISAQKDCAFVLLAAPSLLTEEAVAQMVAAENIFVVIDSGADDWQLCSIAAARLYASRALFGISYPYRSVADWEAARDLHSCSADFCPFIFLYDQEKGRLCDPDVRQALSQWRRSLAQAVFPIALYYDIAVIDQNISDVPCLVMLDEQGRLVVYHNDRQPYLSDQSLADCSLADLLAAAPAHSL